MIIIIIFINHIISIQNKKIDSFFPKKMYFMLIVLLLTSEHLATVVTRSYLLVSVLYKQVAICLLTHCVSFINLRIIIFLYMMMWKICDVMQILIQLTCLFFKCFNACTHLLFVFWILLLLPESSFSFCNYNKVTLSSGMV